MMTTFLLTICPRWNFRRFSNNLWLFHSLLVILLSTIPTIVQSIVLPTGVQLNAAPLSGYFVCYFATYDTITQIANIQTCCNTFPYLLVAGLSSLSSSTFQVGAYAPSNRICTSTTVNAPLLTNGAYWYFTPGYSVGFADSPNINQAKADMMSGGSRLSWHMDGVNGGYRLGNVTGLNSDSSYYKVIYGYHETPTQTPTIAPTAVPSVIPSIAPSTFPTLPPTIAPTSIPTLAPTMVPNLMYYSFHLNNNITGGLTFIQPLLVCGNDTVVVTTCGGNGAFLEGNGKLEWFKKVDDKDVLGNFFLVKDSYSFEYCGQQSGHQFAYFKHQPGCYNHYIRFTCSSTNCVGRLAVYIYHNSMNDLTTRCSAGYSAIVNNISIAEFDTKCVPCSKGTFSSNHFSSCQSCPYPYTTGFDGDPDGKNCLHINLIASQESFIIAFVIIPCFILFSVLLCTGEYRGTLLIVLMMPTFDVLSDIAFIMSGEFANEALFIATLFFVLGMPQLIFMRELMKNHGDREIIAARKIVLGSPAPPAPPAPPKSLPASNTTTNQYPYQIIPKKDPKLEDLLRREVEWTRDLFRISMIIIGVTMYIATKVLWFVLGSTLHILKLFSIRRIWAVWYEVWMYDDITLPSYEHIRDVIDTKELNLAIEKELFFESLPQLIIQIINYVYLREPSTLSLVCLIGSGGMTLFGCYKYIFVRFVTKTPSVDIPISAPPIKIPGLPLFVLPASTSTNKVYAYG